MWRSQRGLGMVWGVWGVKIEASVSKVATISVGLNFSAGMPESHNKRLKYK